jgi:hypothetical protein
MTANLLPYMTEAADLAVTQFLDQYLEMDLKEAHKKIEADWKPQMAVLLTLFVTYCHEHEGKMCRPTHLLRADGKCGYITFLCRCTGKPILGGVR